MISISDVVAQGGAIFAALMARQGDLARYAYTIDQVRKVDVGRDRHFQRMFNGLYMVRRNQAWREVYFALMETYKAQPDVRFEIILKAIFSQTGRIEASFASKLMATVNPSRAVYDSIVRANLGLPTRSGAYATRAPALAEDYTAIQSYLDDQIQEETFRTLRAQFDRLFPQHGSFSDIKVLDLLIWQMR